MTIRTEGLEEALSSLDKRIAKVKNITQAALWEAGLKIMRAAQLRLRASVITGNLRASGYVRSNMNSPVRPEGSGFDQSKNEQIPSAPLPPIGVELGFTAVYALYAHENMEGRAPKFLEQPIKQNERAIAEIIRLRSEQDAERG